MKLSNYCCKLGRATWYLVDSKSQGKEIDGQNSYSRVGRYFPKSILGWGLIRRGNYLSVGDQSRTYSKVNAPFTKGLCNRERINRSCTTIMFGSWQEARKDRKSFNAKLKIYYCIVQSGNQKILLKEVE